MSKFLDFIESWEASEEAFLHGDLADYYEGDGEFSYPEGLTVTVVEQHGGGEGDGEVVYCIYKVVDGDSTKYYKAHGWYASYDGSHYDGIFEVEPYQELVTKYKRV